MLSAESFIRSAKHKFYNVYHIVAKIMDKISRNMVGSRAWKWVYQLYIMVHVYVHTIMHSLLLLHYFILHAYELWSN